jgi:hypothetical protein
MVSFHVVHASRRYLNREPNKDFCCQSLHPLRTLPSTVPILTNSVVEMKDNRRSQRRDIWREIAEQSAGEKDAVADALTAENEDTHHVGWTQRSVTTRI